MVAGTVLAVFFVPVFFVAVRTVLKERRTSNDAALEQPVLET
jgi:hypothetical protein